MNNKYSKIIIPLLSVTSIVLLSSISISLAWYATGNSLTIDNMKVTLASEPALEIGIKNDNQDIIFYKNEVPYTAIENKIVKEFEPVSSMYCSSWINNKENNPTFYSKYTKAKKSDTSTFKKTNKARSGYFELEFYLKSDRDIFVTLDESSYLKANKDINKNKANQLTSTYLGLSKEQIETNLNNIENSLRISLLEDSSDYKFNIIDPKKDIDTPYFGILDLNNDHYYDSYVTSDNKKQEFLFGEYYNDEKIVYKYNDVENEITDFNTFSAKHEANSYSVDLATSIENGLTVNYENSVSLSEVTSNLEFIKLDAFIEKRFVLDIYIEGWDKDNITLVEFGAFTSLIKFKVTKENYYE